MNYVNRSEVKRKGERAKGKDFHYFGFDVPFLLHPDSLH
jgi:hypothetical protein